jgi:hypothetical protein
VPVHLSVPLVVYRDFVGDILPEHSYDGDVKTLQHVPSAAEAGR